MPRFNSPFVDPMYPQRIGQASHVASSVPIALPAPSSLSLGSKSNMARPAGRNSSNISVQPEDHLMSLSPRGDLWFWRTAGIPI
jgi:hypothetical protein